MDDITLWSSNLSITMGRINYEIIKLLELPTIPTFCSHLNFFGSTATGDLIRKPFAGINFELLEDQDLPDLKD